MFTTFHDLPYLEIGKQTIRAFLLAARRSRRATGYAIASVRCTMRASTHALRMPNANQICMFLGFFARAGLRPALASIRKLFKNNTTSKMLNVGFLPCFSREG
jgi:hypothetical protein